MVDVDKSVQQSARTPSTARLFACGVLCVGLASGCSLTGRQSATAAKPNASAQQSGKAARSESPGKTPTEAAGLTLQDFSVGQERGQTILFVRFSKPVTEFRHFQLPDPSRIVLDVFGHSGGPARSDSFRIGTNWVETVRLSSSDGTVRLTADLAGAKAPPYGISPEDGGLRIVIGHVDVNGPAARTRVLVKTGVHADGGAAGDAPDGKRIAEPVRAAALRDIVDEPQPYTGQKISLDFKDADIKNVLRLLAEVSGKNLVVTDDVSKKVTIRLHEVPWDQALDILLNTNSLVKEEVGNVIRISTAGRLKSDRDQHDTAGTLQTAYFTVNYARVIKGGDEKNGADKDLVDKIKVVLSRDGKVEADQRTNTVIVRDTRNGIERVQNLLARLDKRTPQVLIESNLIETTPSFSRSLGIEMEALFNDGRIRTSSRFRADKPFDGSPQPIPSENKLIVPNTGFRFGYFGNNITSVLSAAEAEGNVKIISRPSVVTLNNVESTIESSETIRVKTAAATVGESGSIQTFKAGVILTVTPQVSADGFILLKIAVKNSAFDFSNTVDLIPRETAREAKANIMVRDGETVVIGGIMKDTTSSSDTGLPYLRQIPVLGWLFKKTSSEKNLDEMVVFITPRIIDAGAEDRPTAEQIWREQMKKTEGASTAAP